MSSRVDLLTPHAQSLRLRDELYAARRRLEGTIAGVLESESFRRAIAERSVWHPNGFAKIVLTDDRRVGQLRIHVWNQPSLGDDIHGHAWTYESVVLAGELTETTHEEAPAGQGLPMWRHTYGRAGPGQFSMSAPAPVRLSEVASVKVHRVGDRSGGVPGHIHRFGASATLAVTLLRVGPILKPGSYVYRTTAARPHLVTPRPTTPQEVGELLEQVVEAVPGSQG